MICLREVAWQALCRFKEERMEDFFARNHTLSFQDLKLAKEIAYGTVKRLLTLEFWAKRLSSTGKLHLKAKEKMLLYMAIYQHAFLDRVPLYAIVDETVQIARKHFGKMTAGFFNALLRALPEFSFDLPKGKTAHDLSIIYSYPSYFVELLLKEYGVEKTEEILGIQNQTFPVFARKRKEKDPLHVIKLQEEEDLEKIGQDPGYYIQNPTPVFLLKTLSKNISPPTSILDLCASPGGKLIACRDLFPKAELFANDVSEKKCARLQENFDKYGIQAELTCQRGEEFISERTFDLILLDVPCSNSGVLHKRPEARWRLIPEKLEELKTLQQALIKNAVRYLAPGGQIWYLTCSILQEENEIIVEEMARTLSLRHGSMIKKLPDKEGFDGGFSCALF